VAAGRSVTALPARRQGDASNGMHAASTLKAHALLERKKVAKNETRMPADNLTGAPHL